MSEPSIGQERHQISMARSKKSQELLREYDETVYRPALSALRDRCEAAGHGRQRLWSNGLGWAWNECTACGARVGDAFET